jgi:anti-sigma factor RsiW
MYNHPDSEQLDMLRAGLLDDTPGGKAVLEQHLAGCPACREQAAPWGKLASRLDDTLQPAGIREELQRARQAALATGSRHTHRALIPFAAAATLLIAITVGILGLPTGKEKAPSAATQTAQAIPDTYEDLDFYLWLASQDKGHPAKAHADPNST